MFQSLGRFIRAVVLFALLLFVSVQVFFASCIWYWRYEPPESTRFMRIRAAEMAARQQAVVIHRQWLAYPAISVHIKRAVVAAEDDQFLEHAGFDWDAIQAAYRRNQAKGKVSHGASTITQQLAKNLFLSGERSYIRKAQEFLIAMMLEAILDKRRIFEIYLNSVEWGEGIFGIEAAARHYFQVSAKQLNPDQAARLAAMLPSPRLYDRVLRKQGKAGGDGPLAEPAPLPHAVSSSAVLQRLQRRSQLIRARRMAPRVPS